MIAENLSRDIHVIVFDDLGKPYGGPELLRPKGDAPAGYQLKATRKFMVFRDQDEFLVAFGPVIGPEYSHQAIVDADRDRYRFMQASGGGEAILESNDTRSRWFMTLRGTSSSYGNFDPGLFTDEMFPILKGAIGMSIAVNWTRVL